MHSSLLEKFTFSLLIFAWLIFGSMTVGDMLVHVNEGDIEALRITTNSDEADTGMESAAVEAVAEDITTLLATADAAAGAKVFKKCASCHSTDNGGKNKVGPNLWNIVGGAKASVSGFSYSGVLSGLGGSWSYAELDAFLASPKEYAPGTKMSFKGISKPAKRAALIAFLRGQSDSPLALP